MEFWQSLSSIEPEHAQPVARTAEALGFTGVTVGDHLVSPVVVESAYPYQPPRKKPAPSWGRGASFPDPFQLIAGMAASTTVLRFTTSVLIVPVRCVFSLAKSVSTAAVLSGERVVLGAGVGWMKEEFDLTGHNFSDRGPRTDEMLEIVAKLLAGGAVEHHGTYYDFPAVEMSPVPSTRVPVFVGGVSDPALRRAARWDGWLSPPTDISALSVCLARLARIREAGERRGESFEIMACFEGELDVETCLRAEELGVTSVLVPSFRYRGLAQSTLADKQRWLESFATRMMARF